MADFHFSHVVCNCKHVTLGEIIHSIKDRDAKSIEDVATLTDAGTACKCCRCPKDDFGQPKMELYIEQIVNKFV